MSITQRGADTYLVRVYVGRNPLTGGRIEINQTARGSAAHARKCEAKLKGQIVTGRVAGTRRMSLDKLLDSYLDWARHCQSATTQHKNHTFLDIYVRPYVGHTPLRKVTGQLLDDLFNLLMDGKEKGGRGLAPNTVKIIRKLLAATFNYGVRQKLIADNPVAGTKLPRVVRSKANSLTFKEAEALESVKDDLWYGNAFVFQLYTGLRPQELMALIWGDIDFERGTLRVERACKWINGVFTGFGTTKTLSSTRTLKLGAPALTLLREHHKKQLVTVGAREAGTERYEEAKIKEWAAKERPRHAKLYDSAELIFPKRGGGVPNCLMPRLEFKRALRRAGIAVDYRWYDLRHTNASFQIKLGVALTEVAAKMGHTLAELVHTYAHHIDEERIDAPAWLAKLVPV